MRTILRATYKDVVGHYGLTWCEGPEECPEGWSRIAHTRGRTDSHGVIHSSRLGVSARRDRLGDVLALVAERKLRHAERRVPRWQAIYESYQWAQREAIDTWHVRLSVESTAKARRRVIQIARFGRVPLRYHHPAIYQWAKAGERYGGKEARGSRVDQDGPKVVLRDGSQPGGNDQSL